MLFMLISPTFFPENFQIEESGIQNFGDNPLWRSTRLPDRHSDFGIQTRSIRWKFRQAAHYMFLVGVGVSKPVIETSTNSLA